MVFHTNTDSKAVVSALPPEDGGSDEEGSRIPSNEEQLADELNIAFANGWSADCVRLGRFLVGSCLREVWCGLALTVTPLSIYAITAR